MVAERELSTKHIKISWLSYSASKIQRIKKRRRHLPRTGT